MSVLDMFDGVMMKIMGSLVTAVVLGRFFGWVRGMAGEVFGGQRLLR